MRSERDCCIGGSGVARICGFAVRAGRGFAVSAGWGKCGICGFVVRRVGSCSIGGSGVSVDLWFGLVRDLRLCSAGRFGSVQYAGEVPDYRPYPTDASCEQDTIPAGCST